MGGSGGQGEGGLWAAAAAEAGTRQQLAPWCLEPLLRSWSMQCRGRPCHREHAFAVRLPAPGGTREGRGVRPRPLGLGPVYAAHPLGADGKLGLQLGLCCQAGVQVLIVAHTLQWGSSSRGWVCCGQQSTGGCEPGGAARSEHSACQLAGGRRTRRAGKSQRAAAPRPAARRFPPAPLTAGCTRPPARRRRLPGRPPGATCAPRRPPAQPPGQLCAPEWGGRGGGTARWRSQLAVR